MIALIGRLVDVVIHLLIVRPEMGGGGGGVGGGMQAAGLQRLAHLLHVPGCNAVGDMIDGRRFRRWLLGKKGVGAAADHIARIAGHHFHLGAFVKGAFPAQQVRVERRAALVVVAAIGEVIEPHGLPAGGREGRG